MVFGQRTFDVRNNMHDMAIVFDHEFISHPDGANLGNTAYIIASEIKKHQVFSAFLGVSQ
jgi:hypothetical protein